MRRTVAPMTLVIAAFAAAFVLGIVPTAQADQHKECSNASLQGSFGYHQHRNASRSPAAFRRPFR